MTPDELPPLSGRRILDLSDGVAGQFAGRILADLGAEVLLAEPPSGCTVRSLPPRSAAGDSALFWHLNNGKTAVQLPPGPGGAGRVRELAASCDAAVIDGSTDPGLALVLGEDPGLVLCQVTDFADEGPYAGWLGSEMIHQALSGLMFLTRAQAAGTAVRGAGSAPITPRARPRRRPPWPRCSNRAGPGSGSG